MNKDIFREINAAKTSYEVMFVVGIICTIVGFLIFMGLPPLGMILFIGGALLTGFGKSGHTKVVARLKDAVVKAVLSEFVVNGIYRSNPGIASDKVYQSEILRKADRYSSEDYLEGDIDNVHFVASDLHLEDRHSDGKNTHYTTIFRGQFYQFEFNKRFSGKTFVMEGGMPSLFHGYEKVKLESEVFNSVFNTYTNYEHDTFYILTPHFMEALLELEAIHPGKISISFIHNHMNIAIHNKRDFFHLPMFRNYDETIIREFRSDLRMIKNIIDSLKLNREIFKSTEEKE